MDTKVIEIVKDEDITLTWKLLGKDNKGRFIGGDVMAICDKVPCTNHIVRSLGSICGGTFDTKPHCGAFMCAEHLAEHETEHKVKHFVPATLVEVLKGGS